MSPRLAASYRHSPIVRLLLAAGLAGALMTACGDDDPGAGIGTPSSGTPSSGTPTTSTRPTSGPTGFAGSPTPQGTAVDITDLELGDCFTEPSGELVERITRVDCAGPHDAEVYAVADLPSGSQYPGDATVEAQADQACTDASSAVDQDKLPGSATIGYFFPTEDNWSADGSTARCYVASDDAPLIGSVRR